MKIDRYIEGEPKSADRTGMWLGVAVIATFIYYVELVVLAAL